MYILIFEKILTQWRLGDALAPTDDRTILPERQAVPLTGGERDYVCCIRRRRRLSVHITSPGGYGPVRAQCEAMVVASSNGNDVRGIGWNVS
jgi:hypothetical protein